MSSPSVQDRIRSFNLEQYNSIDDEISQFNQIINGVAKSCLVPSRKKRKNTKKSKPRYDNTCRHLKKQLQGLAKKIGPNTHQSLRQECFVLKKKYKRQVKHRKTNA